jgi:hypothetical protein
MNMKEFEFTQDFEEHKKGETCDYDETDYGIFIHPLLMRGVLKRTGVASAIPIVDMDLNRDGKIDETDFSLAGRVLSKSKKVN